MTRFAAAVLLMGIGVMALIVAGRWLLLGIDAWDGRGGAESSSLYVLGAMVYAASATGASIVGVGLVVVGGVLLKGLRKRSGGDQRNR